ncbi:MULTISPECIES: acyltransferase [Cyanophyceae]|uniref:acyltransferase n=1 Tax=Cyanophyceae TaxID=3028117 RepID=UPI0024111A2B|nr:acyltransferase [Phormidium sp. FACHB-592]
MAFDVRYFQEMYREKWKVTLLTIIFGSVPLKLGKRLRGFVYRSFLGQLGDGAEIGVGLELVGAKRVFFEANTIVNSNIFIDSWEPQSCVLLGSSVKLDRGADLKALGGCIEIGERTYIGPYFCAAGPGDIKIGKNCMIASHSSMYANNHIFSDRDVPIAHQGVICKGILIEDDCWLGTGVRVLDGVTIGRGSVIGAGAVVTKDIPPFSVAVGVPAKVMAQRGEVKSELFVTTS